MRSEEGQFDRRFCLLNFMKKKNLCVENCYEIFPDEYKKFN